jgi:hypothetical protein
VTVFINQVLFASRSSGDAANLSCEPGGRPEEEFRLIPHAGESKLKLGHIESASGLFAIVSFRPLPPDLGQLRYAIKTKHFFFVTHCRLDNSCYYTVICPAGSQIISADDLAALELYSREMFVTALDIENPV